MLYEMEITAESASTSLERRDVPLGDYAIDIVRGVTEHRAAIDEALSRNLRRWKLERLTAIDRTLARIAAWELGHNPDVPTGVVLSELVELAGQYSGADAPQFLNGLLAAVAEELREGT